MKNSLPSQLSYLRIGIGNNLTHRVSVFLSSSNYPRGVSNAIASNDPTNQPLTIPPWTEFFEFSSKADVISYSSLVSGYAQARHWADALEVPKISP